MHAEAAEMRPQSVRMRRRKLRLRTLGHLDGRTTAARRAGALVATFEAELGGELTGAQRLAVHNAAALTAIAEDAQARRLAGDTSITLDDLVRATSAARRAVRDLGLDRKREPAAPSLSEYLRSSPMTPTGNDGAPSS
jgi:hypothetical protein